MTTWTCKGLVAGLGLMMILAGCTEDGGLALDVPASGGQAAVTSTVLGDGRVALTAPTGFCIDPTTIDASGRDGFAMLALCSRLSPQTAFATLSGQSPAVMTVTTTPWTRGDTPITARTIADAYPDNAVAEARSGAVPMVRAAGVPPLPGLDEIHWRGAFVVNDQLVVLGLFAPEDSRALGSTGANLLGQLARRTNAASRRLSVAGAASADN
ncbi:hypothetical protein [Marinibacterium profundimaris]|uniref:hypothetical protein n=1 Tax=Marinibacterium profundimaris TaxID=1679460 RepID=UPI00117FBA38|nr:hypothetical protein [Marinibacterium profundimaris]